MSVDLGWLAAETRALKLAARRVNRSVNELKDMQAGELDRLELPAGELDERAVIDFLRRTLSSIEEGVVLIVSQPARAQTKEESDHAEDVQRAGDGAGGNDHRRAA